MRVAGQSVDIQATNAPLTEVLERLSRQTQMKVVYEGAPPRQMISLDLRGRTPVEVVVAALEGQGVNYAMSMDDTGTRVQTLLVTGTATSSAPSRASAAPDIPDRHVPRDLAASEAVIEEPEPVQEDEGSPAAGHLGGAERGQSPDPGGDQGRAGRGRRPAAGRERNRLVPLALRAVRAAVGHEDRSDAPGDAAAVQPLRS